MYPWPIDILIKSPVNHFWLLGSANLVFFHSGVGKTPVNSPGISISVNSPIPNLLAISKKLFNL